MEAGLGQAIKGLLQVGELEVEAGRVLLRLPVGVAALVERVPEDLLGQRDAPAHHDARHAPELGVGLVVAHGGVGAPVAQREEARALVRRAAAAATTVHSRARGHGGRRPAQQQRVAATLRDVVLQVALAALVVERVLLDDLGRQQLDQVGELEILGLAQEPLLLGEVLRQRELLVPQIIQHIPEKEAVPVDEEARPAVPGQLAPAPGAATGTRGREHAGQSAVRDAEQRRVLGHIDLAAHIQLHYFGEGRGCAGPRGGGGRRAGRAGRGDHLANGQDGAAAAARVLQSHSPPAAGPVTRESCTFWFLEPAPQPSGCSLRPRAGRRVPRAGAARLKARGSCGVGGAQAPSEERRAGEELRRCGGGSGEARRSGCSFGAKAGKCERDLREALGLLLGSPRGGWEEGPKQRKLAAPAAC